MGVEFQVVPWKSATKTERRAEGGRGVGGGTYMTSAKFSDCLTPPPLVK